MVIVVMVTLAAGCATTRCRDVNGRSVSCRDDGAIYPAAWESFQTARARRQACPAILRDPDAPAAEKDACEQMAAADAQAERAMAQRAAWQAQRDDAMVRSLIVGTAGVASQSSQAQADLARDLAVQERRRVIVRCERGILPGEVVCREVAY